MKYKLIDLLDFKTQGVNTTTDNISYVDKGYKIVQAKNIAPYNITFDDSNYIDEETFNRIKDNHKLHKEEVLYTNIGSQLGNSAIYESDEEAIITWNVMKLIPNKEIIDNYYLCYLLNSNKSYIKALNTSSTMPFVSGKELMNVEFDVPDLIIQKKIVKILKDIEDKIKINNEINNNLQELINNIFTSRFINYDGYNGEYKTTEIGDIPIDWDIDSFGNVISFSNGYGWDSKDMLENSMPDTYKVFKMGNIKIGGGINKEKTKSWILKEKCSGLEQYLSKKGDVLMCMTDMKSNENPLLGHTALIDRDDEFVINQRVGIIRCDKEIKWPYIYTMTNLPFFISDIRSKSHSGVQVNLTTSGICDTKVLIPDKDVLNEFYQSVTPMYEKMFILSNEVESLEKLRDTLLPKLMNGEIDLDNIEI